MSANSVASELAPTNHAWMSTLSIPVDAFAIGERLNRLDGSDDRHAPNRLLGDLFAQINMIMPVRVEHRPFAARTIFVRLLVDHDAC